MNPNLTLLRTLQAFAGKGSLSRERMKNVWSGMVHSEEHHDLTKPSGLQLALECIFSCKNLTCTVLFSENLTSFKNLTCHNPCRHSALQPKLDYFQKTYLLRFQSAQRSLAKTWLDSKNLTVTIPASTVLSKSPCQHSQTFTFQKKNQSLQRKLD